MADVQFAPPLQRLAAPTNTSGALAPTLAPPPPPPAPAPAPALRLSTPAPVITSSTPVVSFQDLIHPAKDARPAKRKKKRGKKLLTMIILLGMIGGAGYYFRNAAPVQRLLGRDQAAAPLPDVPFVRPTVTSAEFSITLSAVQNGVPNNLTTKVQADYVNGIGQSMVESQVGGAFSTSQEFRTRESIIRPGQAFGAAWTRQPRLPEAPSAYDTAEFIPMIDDIVDQPLRDALKPKSSKMSEVDAMLITTLTYVIDRAEVPEIAPAIFARVPWLFDVPNATMLTVEVSYDESGLVRHLFFGVDPPQPGTGIDATWVTSYTMDVTSLNASLAIPVPTEAIDVPPGTP